jgi:tetratricopeptide (TPR) repeat protein
MRKAMSKPPFTDLQRWCEEVARDPAAPAFLQLAQSYRRRGQNEAAIQLCVRALARNSAHLEGHLLLAQLYLELGEHERAGDEWSIVLRLDPGNFEAHRGLGFYGLERRQHLDAERHLQEAARQRPTDTSVLGALALLAEGEGGGTSPPAPGQIFAPLLADTTCIGVVILDSRGLVLAGGLRRDFQGSAEKLAALLGGVLAEASRALGPAGIGVCRGVLLETEEAMLHLAPLGEGHSISILVEPGTPIGWISRLAGDAAALGSQLLEGGS